MQTPKTFGANGVIGIGVFAQDCGSYCAQVADNYFYQTSSGWSATPIPVTQQLQNPVTLFSQDNNGTILSMNAMTSTSANYVAGTLIFGVDTQLNNVSANTNTILLDSEGYLTTQFNYNTYANSFIDSGSNGDFFNVNAHFPISALVQCSDSSGFYCPVTQQTFNAAISGQTGSTSNVNITFKVDNAKNLYGTAGIAAINNLAGTGGDYSSFDWGLPFFYGRSVYNVVSGQKTTKGTGPYVGW